jgi:hypothetical protein
MLRASLEDEIVQVSLITIILFPFACLSLSLSFENLCQRHSFFSSIETGKASNL